MTRRKKSKSAVNQSTAAGVNAPATATHIATTASAGVVLQDKTTAGDRTTVALSSTTGHIRSANGKNEAVSNLQIYKPKYPSTTSSSTATSSNARSTISSSNISETASTSSLKPNDKTLKNKKPKKRINTKVSYVTKQIQIYPTYPILTVDRLPNLDYHISALTESIGRRPRVYQHGKGVRFVPESNDEFRTIQRYLAKIESAERIAWCSYTVPPGNSLKVNVKVRVVEVIKVTEDLEKLKLQNSTNTTLAKSNLHVNSTLPTIENTLKDVKISAKNSLHKESNATIKESSIKDTKIHSKNSSVKDSALFTKDSLLKDIEITTEDSAPKDINLTTTATEPKESHIVDKPLRNRRLPTTATERDKKLKKPRDIAQNRSYKKANIY